MVNKILDPAPLDVLADGTRRRIVVALAARPRAASELAGMFRVTKPAISRHLRLLRGKGIIEQFRIAQDGRIRMFRLRPQSLDQVRQWTETVHAFWEQQLNAFAEVAREEAAHAHQSSVRTKRHSRGRRKS